MFHALHKVDMRVCYAKQKIDLAYPKGTFLPSVTMPSVTILLSFIDILSKVCGAIGNPKLYLPDCICSLRFALTLMLLVSIGLVTSEQQLRFSLKKKNLNHDDSLDVTTLNLILSYPHFFLNCPKQRGLLFGESGLVG